jgi:SRSO17 transposase
LLDADLFLPESWSEDRPRCREAGIPDDVVYRPKWRLGLDQVYRAMGNGIALDWLTFDEGYGCRTGFLAELDALAELRWVGEVPKSFRGLTAAPKGKKPRQGWTGKRADNLACFSPVFQDQAWRRVTLRRQTLGDQAWQAKAAQVYLLRDGKATSRTYWLIAARNAATEEVNYFVSNAPADAPLERLLRIAFTRWNVEHGFRVAKSEIGFGHYEGRNYTGMMRHLMLCLVAPGFVAGQAERLRGGKPGGNAGAGVRGVEPTLCGMADQPPADVRVDPHVRGHRVSPAA